MIPTGTTSNPIRRRDLSRRRLLALAGGLVAAGPTGLAAAERIKIRDLWGDRGAFAPVAEKFAGQEVDLSGYMAPPLKPEIDFFVLTRIPMAVCPFCDSEASWPEDLVLVYVPKALTPVDFNELLRVTGVLDLGTKSDPGTGFVSRVRLLKSRFQRV